MMMSRLLVVLLAGYLVFRVPDPSTYALAALAASVVLLELGGKER
jgi:hypothetical protein